MNRAALLTAAALTGCAADTSHLRHPLDLSGWTSTVEPRPILTDEVLAAPDPAQTSGEQIDLATVLWLAGSESLDIALARSMAAQAAHLAAAERARTLPFLVPRLQFFRHQGHAQQTGGAFIDVDKQNTAAGAAVELVLQPASAYYRTLAARHAADAAAARYRATGAVTLMQAALRYFDLTAAHAKVAIAAQDLDSARELLRVEEARAAAGAGLPATVARARARLAETEGLLEQARATATGNSAALVALLDLRPETALLPKVADAVTPLELVDADEQLSVLLARARAQHPGLDAARHAVVSAAADASHSRWGWMFPEIRAGASADGFGATPGNLEQRENYYVGLQWSLDLGLPSRHAANVERQRQEAMREKALENRIAAAVVGYRSQVHAARSRVAAAQRGVEAATEALALASARHREGAGLVIEVLDAQAALTRARSGVVQAVADHNKAQYGLVQAVGGPR